MSYRELRRKFVICKKPHECEWCAIRIRAGERANSRTVAHDEGVGTYWSHLDCWDALVASTPAMQAEGWENWLPGDFKRGEVYESE